MENKIWRIIENRFDGGGDKFEWSILDGILGLKRILDEDNIPLQGRTLALSKDTMTKIFGEDVNETRILGFDVIIDN